MTHDELRHLAGLLREVLVMNPIERKSAGEVAKHCWLLESSRESDLSRCSQCSDGCIDQAEIRNPEPNFTVPQKVDS